MVYNTEDEQRLENCEDKLIRFLPAEQPNNRPEVQSCTDALRCFKSRMLKSPSGAFWVL